MGIATPSLSHGSEMGQIAHVSPQHQMQQQTGQQQQQSMCLQTPTTNPGSVSNMISNLVNPQAPGGSVPQSQPLANQQQQQKEFNIVSLCRFGQETVQDISRLERLWSVFDSPFINKFFRLTVASRKSLLL